MAYAYTLVRVSDLKEWRTLEVDDGAALAALSKLAGIPLYIGDEPSDYYVERRRKDVPWDEPFIINVCQED